MVIKRGWLENSLYMVLSALQQIALDVFSRRRSEGFPFIVWGSGGWTLVRLECLVGSASHRRRVVNSVSMGEAPNFSFSKVSKQVVMSFAWQAWHFVTFQPV